MADRLIVNGRNRVEVSADRRHMVIHAPGRRAEMRSARPGGFIAKDIERASDWEFPTDDGVVGQVNRAWSHQLRGWTIYLHVGTGPPTWWWPRIKLRWNEGMVGWLRGMVAVSVKREDRAS